MFATIARGVQIEVTANRSDEEPGRVDRLNRVIGYVHALATHYGNNALLNKVTSIYDHKGNLTVCWCAQPAVGEMELFNKAWRDEIIGDAWGPVEHTGLEGHVYAKCDGPGSTNSSKIVSMNIQR